MASISLLVWGIFFSWWWPRIFFVSERGIETGVVRVWADWAVHATYASVFAYRPWSEWLIGHPLYAGARFTYPFLADAVSGWLMRLGLPLVDALVIPSIVLSLLFVFFLSCFYARTLGGGRSPFLAVTLFFLLGGLGYYWFAADLWNTPTWSTLLVPPREYTEILSSGIIWISVINAQLLPQRAFLMALPWGLIVLQTLYHWSEDRFLSQKWWHVGVLGLFTGILVLIHVHTLIVLALLCAVWLVHTPQHWKTWFLFAVSTGVVALPLFLGVYGSDTGSNFIQWYPGWSANPQSLHMNWLWFWFLNLGIFLPLALAGTRLVRGSTRILVRGAWCIFLLANVILFQPYTWDNSKLFTWVFLILTIPVMLQLRAWWNARWYLGVFLLFVSMILSSSLDLWRTTQLEWQPYVLWNQEEWMLAQEFRQISQTTDLVLTADQHNHWVSSLTGRPIVMGYRGWLWSYGFEYSKHEHDVLAMFAGGPEAEELLSSYGVKFAVIGPAERRDFRPNEAWFQERYPLVLQNAEYQVFAIR